MGRDGAAGAEVMRMRGVRSGRWKLGWSAAVAVAIALVGHAMLMAGGGHPTEAARAVYAPVIAAPHESTGHQAATAPEGAHAAHAGHVAPRTAHAGLGPGGSPAASTVDAEAGVEHHPTGGGPTEHETAGCGGMLALAWPQAQPALLAESTSVVLPPAVDPVVIPVAESRVLASRLDPTDPPGTRRALLQIYRI